jgi:hypothetical protein
MIYLAVVVLAVAFRLCLAHLAVRKMIDDARIR